ncbi:MAG TPA: hypothetical protein VEL07_22895 [Planctomycetota bacterium]|nr:hypothetical protein [Planctomycetota bacterium]
MPLPPLARIVLAAASLAAALAAGEERGDPGVATRRRLLEERVLPHFAFGVGGPAEWIRETRDRHGCQWRFLAQYLSGGAGWDGVKQTWDTVFLHDWDRWTNPERRRGVFAELAIRGALDAGCTPWLTFYNLAQSHPADYLPGPKDATPVNAANATTMRAYWEQAKVLMQACDRFRPHPIVVHVEPDEWGHLLLAGRRGAGGRLDPAGVAIQVGGSGMPELAGLSDDLRGFSEAFVALRARYAPHNVLLAANPSLWDRAGTMRASEWVRIFQESRTTRAAGWDLAVLESGTQMDPSNPAGSFFTSFAEGLEYIAAFTHGTGLPVVFWQVSHGNTWFRTSDGSPGHPLGAIPQGLLERYPANDAIARLVAAGCVGFVFSAGGESPGDGRQDGITNPEPVPGNLGHVSAHADDDGGYLRLRGEAYYKRPYPVYAAKATPARTRAAKAARVPAPVARAPAADVLAAWRGRLQRLVIGRAGGARPPRFRFAGLGSEAEILAADDQGARVRIASSGGEASLAIWTLMDDGDRRRLAEAVTRADDAEASAVAAFFCLLAEDRGAARDHLLAAGAGRADVEAAFAPPAPAP